MLLPSSTGPESTKLTDTSTLLGRAGDSSFMSKLNIVVGPWFDSDFGVEETK